jgi:hypothetical protein
LVLWLQVDWKLQQQGSWEGVPYKLYEGTYRCAALATQQAHMQHATASLSGNGVRRRVGSWSQQVACCCCQQYISLSSPTSTSSRSPYHINWLGDVL